MRPSALLLVALSLHAVTSAQSQPGRPLQADGVVRLLADLEGALESGRPDEFRALASPTLPDPDVQTFERSTHAGEPTTATVRERGRIPVGAGYRVLAEVLVSRGRVGRLTTWQITAQPRAGSTDRYEIAGLTESASINGLLKLALDTTRQFAVHSLTFRALDLTLKMSTGSAFVAESEGGITILVLRGPGTLHFDPPGAAEQGQLKILSGHPEFDTTIDTAFIRINSGELGDRLSEHALVPSAIDRADLGRAQAVFDDMAPRSFNVDLGDLSPDRWSIEPTLGSVLVEFKTPHYGWLTYARSPGDVEDVSLFDRARRRNLSVYASAEHLAARGPFYSDDSDVTYDVERYDLDVAFDPARSWINGRGTVRLKTKDPVSTLTLRLAPSLAVSSVSSPTFGRLLSLRVIGQSLVIINLPRPIDRGAELTLDIDYSGRLEPQQLDRDALAPTGHVPVPSGQEETLLVAEPRFMYSSRVFWYPQSLVTDYATATMRLTVPSEYQVVASGTLTGSSVGQVRDPRAPRGEMRYARTLEFQADRPAPYLACVISRFEPVGSARVDVSAVAPPSLADLPTGATPSNAPGVNLEVVATPRQAGGKNRQLPTRVADIVRVYSAMIGEAPYPNFTVVAADDNLPGGHSPAYFALWQQPLPTTPYTWKDDPVAFDSYPFFVLAHEVAHQWWGQAVYAKNYHEQWLSEGLAQYFAVLYAGADRGPDTSRGLLSQMRQSAAALSPQGPIYLGYRLGHIQGDSRIFRGIVYNKSAVVLHMLRRLIGDDAFMAGLRRYYRQWRFHKAGTDDLRAAFEAGTSVPLGRFFQRWVLESALPRLRVTSRIEPAGDAAIVRVEQIGETFDLPLSVTVQYADGASEEVTLAVTDAVVERRVALKSRVRRIVAHDDLTLATIVG